MTARSEDRGVEPIRNSMGTIKSIEGPRQSSSNRPDQAEKYGPGEDRGVQVEARETERIRRLTKEQRTALDLLQDMRRRYPEETWDGATCSDATWPHLGTTWPAYINWRTARSLQRLGLVATEYIGPDEGSTITLTAAGVAA